MTPLVLSIIAVAVGIILVVVPRMLYKKGIIDRDDWLTVMIGIISALTLIQLIRAVLEFF